MTKKYVFTVFSISIALLFWFFDAVVHYADYNELGFEVIPSDTNELWMRCVIVVLIVAFGVFADYRRGFEKEDVYRAMLSATHHILDNFLQKTLWFRSELEDSKDVNEDILKLYDQMIKETAAQIRNLDNIQELNKRNIEDRYLPK